MKAKTFLSKIVTIGILSFLVPVAAMPFNITTVSADDKISENNSTLNGILSQEEAVLQKYTIDDLIATQSFLLTKPYEGNGRVIDVDEDGIVDVFDLCLMKRYYKKTGDFFDLASEMFSETTYETVSEGSFLFSENEIINNRIIVKGYSEIDFSSLPFTQILKGPGFLYFVEFDSSEETENAIDALNDNPLVMFAEIDSVIDVSEEMSLDFEENINANANSWGVSAIEADLYSNYVSKNSNSNVKVAVIDTGVDLSHPFFKNRLLSNGRDYGDGDYDPSPYPYTGTEKKIISTVSHGTHVSGTIVDCTPNTNINVLPIKVMDRNLKLSSSGIITALYYAKEQGCSVINCSFGTGKGIDQAQDQVMREIIQSGCTIVVSAGNDRERGQLDPAHYSSSTANKSPANMSECIVVAAIDSSYNYAYFSCYGSSIDVAAPGVSIYSTYSYFPY